MRRKSVFMQAQIYFVLGFFCCSMAKRERFILGSKSNAEIRLIHNIVMYMYGAYSVDTVIMFLFCCI